ncbi:MAG: CvpA family protein, partial [Deltaproteobacteria bacterium]
MLVDLLFLTLCLLFAVVGGFSGFLKQLVHLVALGGAWVAARLTGPHLARLLTGSLGLHPIAALGAGSVLAGTLAFVVVLLGGRLAVRRLRGAGGPRPWERALGVLLGAAKTGTLLSLVLGLIVLADGFVPLRLLPKDSEVVRLVRRHNPVAALPLPLETLHRSLARVATARQGGSDDPLAQALAADPTVGAAAADP